jgi:hypothetical protein
MRQLQVSSVALLTIVGLAWMTEEAELASQILLFSELAQAGSHYCERPNHTSPFQVSDLYHTYQYPIDPGRLQDCGSKDGKWACTE